MVGVVHPGQTQIFNEVDKTHLTQTKCDPNDLDNPDDPAHLQRCGEPTYTTSETAPHAPAISIIV